MEQDNNTQEQSQSLLQDAPDTNTATETTTETTATATETTADRPEWLPEKFKTPEDFAKSYTELEKKIGETPSAPDKYDFSYAQEIGLDMNETQAKEAEDIFRNYGLSNEQAKGMLSLYSDSIQQFAQQYDATNAGPQVDTQAEMQTLQNRWGADYQNNLGALKSFTNTLNKETLSAPLANTAEGVQLIMDAMRYRQGQNPITDAEATQVSAVSIREKINQMRDDAKYRLPQGDPVGDAHRGEIYRLYQQMERMPRE